MRAKKKETVYEGKEKIKSGGKIARKPRHCKKEKEERRLTRSRNGENEQE